MDNRLSAIAKRLQGIEEGVAKVARVPLRQAIKQAYNASSTPGGPSFAALKRPTGKKPVIGLRDYYDYATVGSKVQVTATKKPYAVYHHTGTRFMPPRTPWPKKIPNEWQDSIGTAIRRFVEKKAMG